MPIPELDPVVAPPQQPEPAEDREQAIQETMRLYRGLAPPASVPVTTEVTDPGSAADLAVRDRQRAVDRTMAMRAREKGNLTDDELVGIWAGPNYDPEGEPISGFGMRSKMSLLGDTFEERQAVYEKTYPEGAYEEVPDTDTILYRKTPEDPWKKADPGFFESWSKDFFLKELGHDFADFTGDLPEMIAEGVLLYATKGKVNVAGIKSLFGLMGAGATGSQVQQGVQYLAGTQRETLGEQGLRAAGEGAASGLGAGAGWLLGGTVNMVRRRAMLKDLRPGAREAMEASDRLYGRGADAPVIPLGTLSDAPGVVRLQRQAGTLWNRAKRAGDEVQRQAKFMMDALVDKESRATFMDESAKALAKHNRAIREYVEAEIKYMRHHPRVKGQMAQERISQWYNVESNGAVDNAYRAARALQEPEFNMDPALEYAAKSRKGIETPNRPQVAETPTGLFDEAGEEIVKETTEVSLRRLDPIPGEYKKILDDILGIDPEFPAHEGVEHSVTDRIRAFVRRLDDFALPEAGKKRSTVQLDAAGLSSTLRGVLEEPTNLSGESRKLWNIANKMARDRFETREHLAVVEIMKSGTPSEIVENLIVSRKGTIDNLIAVRKATDAETFNMIRQSFAEKLFDAERREAGGMATMMRNTDPDVLRMLLPKGYRTAMGRAAKEYRKLHQTGLPRALERQSELRPFIREVFDNPETAGLTALHKLVAKEGGIRSPFGRSVRSAVIDEILERSTVKGKAGGVGATEGLGPVAEQFADSLKRYDRISGKMLHATLKEFREKGLLHFLTPGDIKRAGDVEAIQKLMDIAGTDAGTALMGAATIKGVSQLSLDAIADAAHFLGLSRLLTSQWAIKIIAGGAGKVREGLDTRPLMMLGAMFGNLASDIGDQGDSKEYNALLGKPQEATQ